MKKISVTIGKTCKEFIVKTRDVEISGTSLMGYVSTTRKYLEMIFGPPETDEPPGPGDKVCTEWAIEAEGIIFTLYDWKEYRKVGMNERYVWHIGGYDAKALKMVTLLTGLPVESDRTIK